MLKIRLARSGKTNTPFYKVVLTEHSRPPKTGYKEVLGFFNPISKEFKLKDIEKIKEYISNGAQLSDRIKKLMKTNEIVID